MPKQENSQSKLQIFYIILLISLSLISTLNVYSLPNSLGEGYDDTPASVRQTQANNGSNEGESINDADGSQNNQGGGLENQNISSNPNSPEDANQPGGQIDNETGSNSDPSNNGRGIGSVREGGNVNSQDLQNKQNSNQENTQEIIEESGNDSKSLVRYIFIGGVLLVLILWMLSKYKKNKTEKTL